MKEFEICNIKTLNDLHLNQKGYIKNIKCDGSLRRRFIDLGLIKGTQITPVLISPSNDPRAFEIRGSIIAIRKEDAKLIELE